MSRILHADVPGIDRGIDDLPVLFQILHKRVKLFSRDPRRDVQVPFCAVCRRAGAVFVIPVRIFIKSILVFYEPAVFVDLIVDTLRGFIIFQCLERNIAGVDDLAV